MVYVFDFSNGEWIMKDAAPGDPMPGTCRHSISVAEFLGPCRTDICWSDLGALKALQKLQDYGTPADTRVRYAFRRAADGAHKGQSAHYAGLAFDVGKRLTTREQTRLMRIALERCGFDRVEPPYSTPGWLHVEKRVAPPASMLGEYPTLRERDKGVHVLLLQDVLSLHGFYKGMLTGVFSPATASELMRFQKEGHMGITGIADGETWHALMQTPGKRS
ncbi:MAG: peptidoglycan-binding protein [Clostridiales bacterium]|nr:peptidoglycan-binding protein [Clostridiales bacterium]